MDEQSKAEILTIVNRLLASFPSSQAGQGRAAVEAYLIGLGHIPTRHIASAAAAFLQGRVDGHNKAFAPSPAELAAQAQGLWNDEKHAAYRAQQALNAPDPRPEQLSPAEVERRKAMVAKINERLAPVTSKGKPRRFADWNPAEAERQLSERASKPKLPIAVSDELNASPLLQPTA